MPGKLVDRIGIVDRTFKEKSAKGGRVRIQTIVPIDTVERVPDWAKIEVHTFPVALVTDHWVTLQSAGHGLSSLRPIVVNTSHVHETGAFAWVAKSGKENAPTVESESTSSAVRVRQAARYWVLLDQYAKENAKEVFYTTNDQVGKTRRRRAKEYSFTFVDPSEVPANVSFKEYIDKNNFTSPPVVCLCKNEAGYQKKTKPKNKKKQQPVVEETPKPKKQKHQHHSKPSVVEEDKEKTPPSKRRKRLSPEVVPVVIAPTTTKTIEEKPTDKPKEKSKKRHREDDGTGMKAFNRIVKTIEKESPAIISAIEKKTAPNGACDWLALTRIFSAAVKTQKQ